MFIAVFLNSAHARRCLNNQHFLDEVFFLPLCKAYGGAWCKNMICALRSFLSGTGIPLAMVCARLIVRKM